MRAMKIFRFEKCLQLAVVCKRRESGGKDLKRQKVTSNLTILVIDIN